MAQKFQRLNSNDRRWRGVCALVLNAYRCGRFSGLSWPPRDAIPAPVPSSNYPNHHYAGKVVTSNFSIPSWSMKRMMKSRSATVRSPKAAQTARPRRTRAERASVGHFLTILKAGGDARLAKIQQLRRKLKTRSYENELKLSIAVERMASEFSAGR
jgi:hypothetical protein